MFLSFLYPIMLLSSMRNQTDLSSVKKLNQALIQAVSKQKFESSPSSQIGEVPLDKSDIFSRLPKYKYLKSFKKGVVKRDHPSDRLLEFLEKRMSEKRSRDYLTESVFMNQ
ncbi:hypothetical protein BpHYR1_044351 [Brachionus plicatilis]|uniref:Uncharacterized protein n=1 Tax=Brachionus plicatilis TaxID=10195 RepID=A0A3M7ST36_BRAPC|nr:hypothetical protein BpHYR1_044351 [Brachionus plicatilis]